MKLELKKINRTEMTAFINQAIESARNGAPAYEGSLDLTGSTVFNHRTAAEALEHYADLKEAGWTLIHEIPVFSGKLFDFSARKPDALFESEIPAIAERAEEVYKAAIERHNLAVKRQQDLDAEVLKEFERREEQRKADLLADIRADVESRGKRVFSPSDINGPQYIR